MPRMSVRVSYALDEQTDDRIRQLARSWRVSQAEVIRRSVWQAAGAELPPTPAQVVAQYRNRPLPRSVTAAKRWADKNRAARQANDAGRGL